MNEGVEFMSDLIDKVVPKIGMEKIFKEIHPKETRKNCVFFILK